LNTSAADHPYDALTPEVVLDAVDAVGLAVDGRLSALNSYENRVYQVGLTDRSFVIAKFYRPGRWSAAQIDEEHAFCVELEQAEVPVVAPLAFDGVRRFGHAGFAFALFPRRGGRAPELDQLATAEWLGRTLARVHGVGARRRFGARLALPRDLARPRREVLSSGLLPVHLEGRYEDLVDEAEEHIGALWTSIAPRADLRLHGDCHPGNVLFTDAGATLVDFDDAVSGPAVQDLWMLMTGEARQRDALLDGYAQFREFDHGELGLIPALALSRQIHYAGWLAARWDDPSFPLNFPWAEGSKYWETHLADIAEALASDAG
jgi:Ser/Thr protein kinase RdoA (MazF antagonist)